MAHNSPFSVAGMSSSTSNHGHSQNWGSSTSGPLTMPFSESRSYYQPGYMMSASQSNSMANSQRVDDVPVVQTKAKMNQGLSRGSTSDFGMDSMFKSSRQRQTLADEDAPPMNSVNEIPNETYSEATSSRFQPRNSTRTTQRHSQTQSKSDSQSSKQTLYIIVFGYPPDKYSVTVEYFESLGDCTEPEPNTEISNCFRIGYRDAGDAMRAVRKSGDVLGGSWMVGVKWADAAQAEALFGSMNASGRTLTSLSVTGNTTNAPDTPMTVDEAHHSPTPTLGTPIKLAPSASAFRRPGSGGPSLFNNGSKADSSTRTAPTAPAGESRGMLGQVSDLIFGW